MDSMLNSYSTILYIADHGTEHGHSGKAYRDRRDRVHLRFDGGAPGLGAYPPARRTVPPLELAPVCAI